MKKRLTSACESGNTHTQGGLSPLSLQERGMLSDRYIPCICSRKRGECNLAFTGDKL